jgi:hypothetical protein
VQENKIESKEIPEVLPKKQRSTPATTIPGTAAPGKPPIAVSSGRTKRVASSSISTERLQSKKRKVNNEQDSRKKKRKELQLKCLTAMEYAQQGLIATLQGLQQSTAALKELIEAELEDDNEEA